MFTASGEAARQNPGTAKASQAAGFVADVTGTVAFQAVSALAFHIGNAIAAYAWRPVLEPDSTLPEAIAPNVFAGRIKDELAQWKRIAAHQKIFAE